MSAKDFLGLTSQEHAHGFLAAKRHGLSLLWYIQTLVTAVAVLIPDYFLLQTLHFLVLCILL